MECPLCEARLSEWEVRHDKTEVVDGDTVHKSCLIDYQLRMGLDYRLVRQRVREARDLRQVS